MQRKRKIDGGIVMFNVEETIRSRKSIRSYEKRPLSQADREAVIAYMAELCQGEMTPFPAQVRMCLLEAKPGTNTETLGTYGVIRGADTFIGVTVKNADYAMESVGYTFEKLVLYAESLGLGTCWLAGTFDRENFAGAIQPADDELFPIVSPIGYPAGKKTLVDSVFRKVGKSDQRKQWAELFFENSFDTPITREQAGGYAIPLEMVRLAPSAANRQPWRILHRDDAFHFYREKNPKGKYPYDLQRLDVGIAACHFQMAAEEKLLEGQFAFDKEPAVTAPADLKYLFSWVCK